MGYLENEKKIYLKVTPLAKQEDKKQRDPKPNQRLDLATSLHITKSLTSISILFIKSHPSPSFDSITRKNKTPIKHKK